MMRSSGDRIIDVGCGADQLLGHLAKAVGENGEVIGLISMTSTDITDLSIPCLV